MSNEWLVGWLFLRIYVALAIFQPYRDWKQEITNLWNRSGEAGNRTLAACSTSQELNHYATADRVQWMEFEGILYCACPSVFKSLTLIKTFEP